MKLKLTIEASKLPALKSFFVPVEKLAEKTVLHFNQQRAIALQQDPMKGVAVVAQVDIEALTSTAFPSVCTSKSSDVISFIVSSEAVCTALQAMSSDGYQSYIILKLTKRGPTRNIQCLTVEQRMMAGFDNAQEPTELIAAVDIPIGILEDKERQHYQAVRLPEYIPVALELSRMQVARLGSILTRVHDSQKAAELVGHMPGADPDSESGHSSIRLFLKGNSSTLESSFTELSEASDYLGGQRQAGLEGDQSCRVRVAQTGFRKAVRALATIRSDTVSLMLCPSCVAVAAMVTDRSARLYGRGPGPNGGADDAVDEPDADRQYTDVTRYGGIVVFLPPLPDTDDLGQKRRAAGRAGDLQEGAHGEGEVQQWGEGQEGQGEEGMAGRYGHQQEAGNDDGYQ